MNDDYSKKRISSASSSEREEIEDNRHYDHIQKPDDLSYSKIPYENYGSEIKMHKNDAFTYSQNLGYIPPPWLLDSGGQIHTIPSYLSSNNIVVEIPIDPITGRPLYGIEHVTSQLTPRPNGNPGLSTTLQSISDKIAPINSAASLIIKNLKVIFDPSSGITDLFFQFIGLIGGTNGSNESSSSSKLDIFNVLFGDTIEKVVSGLLKGVAKTDFSFVSLLLSNQNIRRFLSSFAQLELQNDKNFDVFVQSAMRFADNFFRLGGDLLSNATSREHLVPYIVRMLSSFLNEYKSLVSEKKPTQQQQPGMCFV